MHIWLTTISKHSIKTACSTTTIAAAASASATTTTTTVVVVVVVVVVEVVVVVVVVVEIVIVAVVVWAHVTGDPRYWKPTLEKFRKVQRSTQVRLFKVCLSALHETWNGLVVENCQF